MCQLTLYHLNKDFDITSDEVKKDIRNFMYITSIINSQEHPDGHGINFVSGKSNRNFTLQSEKSGISGEIVRMLDKKNLDITSPIIFHVRKASTRYSKKDNLKENAHPFEGEEFVLAHNGTFTGQPIVAEKDEDIIDSRIFHRELEKNWKEKDKEDDVTKVLQKTVNSFAGKMALIFRQKSTNEVFVIRNGRADLHKAALKYKGKVVGYALNTELSPMMRINNLGIRFSDFAFDLKEAPKQIETMTLFKVGNDDLEKVGNIYEYIAPIRNVGHHKRGNVVNSQNHVVNNTSGINLNWLVKEFMPATRLSIPEVNFLFTMVGCPLPYITSSEEYDLAEKKLKVLFQTHYRKAKRLLMDDIYLQGVTLQEFHQNYSFPYFILTVKELKAIKQEVLNG